MIRVGYSRVIVAAGFLSLLGGAGGWCGLVAHWGGVVVVSAAVSSFVSSFVVSWWVEWWRHYCAFFWWDGVSIGGSGFWLFLLGVVSISAALLFRGYFTDGF